MQSAAVVTLMPLFFAAYTAAVTCDAFQLAGQPPKCPFPWRDVDPV